MSTRGTVDFYQEKAALDRELTSQDVLATIYHHCDSYPEGLGRHLVRCMRAHPHRDQVGHVSQQGEAYGMSCFAAWVVHDLKDHSGQVYLTKHNFMQGIEWGYHITFREDKGYLTVVEEKCWHLPSKFTEWLTVDELEARIDEYEKARDGDGDEVCF